MTTNVAMQAKTTPFTSFDFHSPAFKQAKRESKEIDKKIEGLKVDLALRNILSFGQLSCTDIQKQLDEARAKQNTIPNPLLVFNSLDTFLSDKNRFKLACEQKLVPQEFVDFAVKHGKQYQELKTDFTNLQDKLNDASSSQKIVRKKQKILKASPELTEKQAQEQAETEMRTQIAIKRTISKQIAEHEGPLLALAAFGGAVLACGTAYLAIHIAKEVISIPVIILSSVFGRR